MPWNLRSGNVIAISRVAVAVAIIVTAQAAVDALPRHSGAAQLVMAAYVTWSGALLVLTRVNWWLSHHLAKLALAVDFAIAFTLLYLTEVAVTGSISPFMASFLFLLLSATLQWQMRGALAIGLLSLVAYLLVGAALQASGQAQDNPWFVRRLVFMFTIGGFMVWLALKPERPKPERLDWPLDAGLEEQFATIARYILDHVPATGVAIAWAAREEPWTIVFRTGSLGENLRKAGPETVLARGVGDVDAILLDRARARALQLTSDGKVEASRGPVPIPLAEELRVTTPLVAPIRSEIGSGIILLAGIKGVSADHLLPVKMLADELGYALDRHEMVLLMQHQEAIRLRADFARDLHDSIAQTLAGSAFRIAALRQSLAAGKDISADLTVVEDSLGREAAHVHAMIADLRRQEPHGQVVDAAQDLGRALDEAASRWGIGCGSTAEGDLANLRRWLVRELQLVIREAVANAVRHAGATYVSMSLEGTPDTVALRISDNGAGFSEDWLGEMPQSIAERVEYLGGTLGIDRETGITRLSITVPRGQ